MCAAAACGRVRRATGGPTGPGRDPATAPHATPLTGCRPLGRGDKPRRNRERPNSGTSRSFKGSALLRI